MTFAGPTHAAVADDAQSGGDVGWSIPPSNIGGVLPIPLTLFLLAAVAVATVDVPLARAKLHGVLPGGVFDVFDRIETFGHAVGVIVVLTAVWLLDPVRRRGLPRLLAAAFGSGLAANVVKLLVARRRPFAWVDAVGNTLPNQFVEWFPLGLNSGAEQSFPSAHTASAVGLALGLAAAYPRGRVFFLSIAALVALQRTVFCSHYASDVLAGAGLAWLFVLGLFRIPVVDRCFRRIESRRPVKPATFSVSRAA
jgi:membrane-associated phospholipid phosphatase